MTAQPLALVSEEQTRPLSPSRENYAIMKDKARNFSSSSLIPAAIKGSSPEQAFANCLIAMEMANIMGEPPLIVMNHIFIVHGRPGFETKYKIARANKSGIFSGRINWRETGEGENLSVTAFATLAETGEEVSFSADMKMAKAEAWTKNSKYQTMPKLMLRYRSASLLISLYAPDVMLGYQTVEEHEDMMLAAGPSASTSPLTAGMLIEQSVPQNVDYVAVSSPNRLNGIPEEGINPETGEVQTGRANDDHGDQNDGTANQEPATDEAPAWKASVDDWTARANAAEHMAEINAVQKQYDLSRAVLPDDVVDDLDATISAARKRIGGAV